MRLLFIVTAFLLWSAPLCHGRQISSVEGLEALRKAFSGVSDFTAEVNQEKQLSVMKRTMKMKGVVRFRKPDLFFLEIVPPYASRMVLRDNVIEQVMGSGVRNRIVLPPEQGLKQWFSKLAAPITSIPEGMSVQAELNGPVYTLTIAPKGNGQVKELVISFQGDGVVKRLTIVERNGDRSTMTFRKFRSNTGLTDRDFSLE